MSECVLTDCENGILHEYDCNDSFGNHTTGVIYCPACHPEQYEPDSDPLIVAAPEMYELVERLAIAWKGLDYPCTDPEQAFELASRLDRLATQASQLLDKIEGGGE